MQEIVVLTQKAPLPRMGLKTPCTCGSINLQPSCILKVMIGASII